MLQRLPNMRRLLVLFAVLVTAVAMPSSIYATTYYVRKSGNDSNNGKAANLAFRTIDKARQVMIKGDVCWVGAGTYEEIVAPSKDGVSTSPIKFMADTTGAKTGDGGQVILASKLAFAILAIGADYNEFHNFTIQASTSGAFAPMGVSIFGSNGFKLVNCTIRNVLVGVLTESSDTEISNCTIDNINTYGIFAYGDDLLVKDTVITRTDKCAIYHMDNSEKSGETVTVDQCLLDNNYMGIYALNTQLQMDGTTIEDSESWAVSIVSGAFKKSNTTCYLRNNGGGVYLSDGIPPDIESDTLGEDDDYDGHTLDYELNNLEITGNEEYGVYGSYVELKLTNCRLENTQSYAVGLAYSKLEDGAGTVIQNNQHGVVGWSNNYRKLIRLRKMTIANNAGDAVVHYGQAGIAGKIQLNECTVQNNGGWAVYSELGSILSKLSTFSNNSKGLWCSRPDNSSALANCVLNQCVVEGIQQTDAFYAYNADVKVKDSIIRNCNHYGVRCYRGKLDVSNSTIEQVGQIAGYALYHSHPGPVTLASPVLKIADSSLLNNEGGAYADKTNVQLDDVTIQNNRIWGLAVNYGNLVVISGAKAIRLNGNGLYVAGNEPGKSTRTLSNWDFSDNTEYGVYATDCALLLDNCKVEGMDGWALGVAHATLQAVNSPIQNNGKGIAVFSDATLPAPALFDVTVHNNAGIAVSHESTQAQPTRLTMHNCLVTNNGGWGLASYHGEVTCTSCTFQGNAQGLYFERDPEIAGAGSHVLQNSIIRNVGTSDCLYSIGSSVDMQQCTLENAPLGGAVVYGQNVTIRQSTIHNVGTDNGHAVYHYYPQPDAGPRGQTVIENSTITDNYAGPYADHTDLTLTSNTITGNEHWAAVSAYGDISADAAGRILNNNGNGLHLIGSATPAGRTLDGWNLSNNESFGLYAVDCDVTLLNCTVQGMTDWGVGLVQATLTTTNSPIRNNGRGVYITSQPGEKAPVLTGVEVDHNGGTGIEHVTDATTPVALTMTNCQVHHNGNYALLSTNGDLLASDCTFQNNQKGLRLLKPDALRGQGGHVLTNVTVSDSAAEDGIYSIFADVQLVGCHVENQAAGHGMACAYGDLTAQNCVFTGNVGASCFAIHHLDNLPNRPDWATMNVQNCTFSSNNGGLSADHTHLIIDNCAIASNLSWAISTSYGDLTFLNQATAINNNGSGLLVVGNTTETGRLLDSFDLSNNGSYGVFAVDCDLTLKDCQISGMQDWAIGLSNATLVTDNTPIVNNGNGVHVLSQAGGREPELTGLYVVNTEGNAVYHESQSGAPATLTVRSCRLENYGEYGLVNMHGGLDIADTQLIGDGTNSQNGIYCFRAPVMLAERTTILGHTGWGLMSYGSNITLRNSVVGNNLSGAYVFNYSGEDTTAAVVNSTFGRNSAYGLVQHNGSSTVVNCIFASSGSGSAGLQLNGGAMDHSHNLFYGYSQSVEGTAPGEGEIVGNPRFTNAAAGDFRIVGSSMAINRGKDLPGVVNDDMAGLARPMFGKWEVGAFEYASPAESAHIVEWTEVK